ncbi:MAG: KUP/HAK/KT family potassium transporter [candidate division WOR-3 bacterium]|nr:KUP/HAK/KT family potassium transporter [candidate division WOR-3 bacterium]MCX7947717.1 KUP/HAK/KT family potassium transporter [candidate division WOR-3 bacterium]MDW8150360.1 KUP/HAK/KT family potassium transporter [candidate division WOR-3 bacterium]
MKKFLSDIYKPLGIVFGDIGTSPIYTLSLIILLIENSNKENIFGIISLIFWSMLVMVSIQYAFLSMRFSIRGEGGKIILYEHISRSIKNTKVILTSKILLFIGIAFFIGDGIITPSISILSAVEGIKVIKIFENISQMFIVIIAIFIAFLLFSIQKGGVDKIYQLFSPIILLWFSTLSILGIIYILKYPAIILALNPVYGIEFLLSNGLKGFLVLSLVILAVTGGEALYSDMGHLGKEPIRNSWFFFVFPSLTINYLGQGAYAIINPTSKSILFEMANSIFNEFYFIFLIITILATIIASQAMISAMFSIFFQMGNIGIFPRIRFFHTSRHLYGQIYSGFINWSLFLCIILVLLLFQTTEKIGHAYGLSVSMTMLITSIFLIILHIHRNELLLASLSFLVFIFDLAFVIASFSKVLEGGYISLIVAIFVLFVIINYIQGQKRVYEALEPIDFKEFEILFNNAYENSNKIKGTAVFLVRDYRKVPPYVVSVMFNQGIIYERNVFLSLVKKDEPFGIKYGFEKELLDGLDLFKIEYGYMEFLDVEKILNNAGINEKVIFYGVEDIITNKWFYKIFSFIKSISPSFDRFYHFPTNKMHGVISRVNLD